MFTCDDVKACLAGIKLPKVILAEELGSLVYMTTDGVTYPLASFTIPANDYDHIMIFMEVYFNGTASVTDVSEVITSINLSGNDVALRWREQYLPIDKNIYFTIPTTCRIPDTVNWKAGLTVTPAAVKYLLKDARGRLLSLQAIGFYDAPW